MVTHTTHSPGPWRVEENGWLVDADGMFVAEIESENHLDVMVAAAAPELLAALRAMVNAAEDSAYNAAPTSAMLRSLEHANIAARAAIAKAEGR